MDGKEYAGAEISMEDDSEFHLPHFILLNLAVGGTHAGRPDASTRFPHTLFVDWVRVYQQ